MIRVMICDDLPTQLAETRAAVENYFARSEHGLVEITGYHNAMELLNCVEATGVGDIVLLDICMPGLSGIQIAREIRARKDKTQIVFLSSSPDFALEAFSVDATYYIVKPYTQEQFDEAMDRAIARMQPKQQKRVILHGENGALHAIDVQSILYIENFHNYRTVFTTEGTFIEKRRPLTLLMDELSVLCPGQFIQPYRGYILNLDAVHTIEIKGITLQNGAVIPIKSGNFRKFRDTYLAWMFQRGDIWR